MVGSEALFMNDVDNLVCCNDAHGAAIGLPDRVARLGFTTDHLFHMSSNPP